MEQDCFKEIKSRLDEYHVQEPDIHLKASKWDRFVKYLVSPTKDPQLFLMSYSGAAVISGSVILMPFLLFILLLLI